MKDTDALDTDMSETLERVHNRFWANAATIGLMMPEEERALIHSDDINEITHLLKNAISEHVNYNINKNAPEETRSHNPHDALKKAIDDFEHVIELRAELLSREDVQNDPETLEYLTHLIELSDDNDIESSLADTKIRYSDALSAQLDVEMALDNENPDNHDINEHSHLDM